MGHMATAGSSCKRGAIAEGPLSSLPAPPKVKSPPLEEFVLAVSTISVVFDRQTFLFHISSFPARSSAKGRGLQAAETHRAIREVGLHEGLRKYAPVASRENSPQQQKEGIKTKVNSHFA